MTLSQAIILGLVQGLGEFLPISSSGHLAIFPWLFGFPDPGLSFDVALHFGTLIAVLAYFWKDWINIFGYSFQYIFLKKRASAQIFNYNLLKCLIIATLPGVAAGFILNDLAETFFRHPLLIAAALFLAGLIILLTDRKTGQKNISALNLKDSFFIGLSQAIAIIPGISRSGATISAGLFLGLDRIAAARFSFLLSAPIIFGAAIFKLKSFFLSGFGTAEIVGILVSTISGLLAIHFLLKFLEKSSYRIFFWYRTALAAIILTLYFFRG